MGDSLLWTKTQFLQEPALILGFILSLLILCLLFCQFLCLTVSITQLLSYGELSILEGQIVESVYLSSHLDLIEG